MWEVYPSDLAPWVSQGLKEEGPPNVELGDERPWKFRGKTATAIVVRMPIEHGCEFGPGTFVVGVLDSNNTLIARSSELFSEGSYPVAIGTLYRIDTAAYRISDTETAFGVRVMHFTKDRHYCFSDAVLHLFRVVGNDVVRILTTDAFYEQFDQIDLATHEPQDDDVIIINDPVCSYGKVFPPRGQSAVFRLLPTQTNGYYDIQRSKKGWPTVVFRWNGHAYALAGKDPIDHHVREEWDRCTGRRQLAEDARVLGDSSATPAGSAAKGAELRGGASGSRTPDAVRR